eukprot:CAMPEP_0170494502 /NCGR_PEP_ID=MMETSP0208-20121228/14677_1 /TAXON_ID=197538 /ORGANISM="Strombidium inclinatum, Strain S3" /LENGTH=70 /DNA_ID=CAMNT_0010770567 /DNA_START=2307 /DNA_END=2519 /DNA_ORIENTATION=-
MASLLCSDIPRNVAASSFLRFKDSFLVPCSFSSIASLKRKARMIMKYTPTLIKVSPTLKVPSSLEEATML